MTPTARPGADDRPRGRRGGPDRGRGQATVEFALVLPLIAVLVVFAVEVGTIVRDQLRAVQIAREAARHAAVGEPVPNPSGATVTISDEGSTVRARTVVVHRFATPGLSQAPPIELEAVAIMRVERG
jgi:hypothetical protein